MDVYLITLFLLFLHCNFPETLTDSRTDRETLLTFRSKIQDPENVLSSWSRNSSHCRSWYGVTCNDNRTEVLALDMFGLGLTGEIPPVLSNLSSLEFLDLSNNSFYGPIPPEFSGFRSLQFLVLSQNALNGSIPDALFQNLVLQVIFLDSNRLTGSIPKNVGSLRSLRVLELSDNSISGVLPSSLSKLSALTNLSIAKNHLTGEIPREIGNLGNLLSIQLSVNNLTGEIPESLYNLSSLKLLSLTQNHLTGTLSKNFGSSFPNLTQLYLAGNRFHGEFPDSMSNLTQIQFLDVSGNGFSGSVPLFGKMKNLVSLNIAQNYFTSGTRQNLLLFDSLTNCTMLSNLQLFSNNISGELPGSIGKLSTNLRAFCVDKNKFTGRFPQEIGNLQNLISLSLEKNLFTGEIPRSIRSLTRLQKLSVQENGFTGEIPEIFGNFSQLFSLTMGYNKFSGKIPSSLKDCVRLSSLDLTGNRLNGFLPDGIFEISSLNYLVLAGNSLTGSVPEKIKNLKNVLAIELSGNQLSGKIPASIRSCSNLKFLMMARNNLSGSIPDSIGDLASLEVVDLSFNNLSGMIPESFLKLKDLVKLNLSFNKFEGEVPIGGVFANLTAVSLQGNDLLCGSDQETSRNFRLARCATKRKKERKSRLKLKLAISGKVPIKGVFANLTVVSLQGNDLCRGDPETSRNFGLAWCISKAKKERKCHLKRKLVIFGISVGIVLVTLACVLVALRTRKSKALVSSPQLKGLPPMISYNDILIATSDFSDENLIGKGGSGSVYKAQFKTIPEFPDQEIVLAVKVLNFQNEKSSTEHFNRECATLKNARHRNLVKIITSCSSIDHKGDEFKALVMEFMPNGSLDHWLYPSDVESSGSVLTLSQRLNILVDVASAVDYLHNDCEPPIVHCDLKPGNVLLDENMIARVGDFGLARFLSQNQTQERYTLGVKGSIGYIAPEYAFGGKASRTGDVYSFGILLLETLIAKRPTDEIFKEGQSMNAFALFANAENVAEIVDSRLFGDLTASISTTTTAPSTSGSYNSRTDSSTTTTTVSNEIGSEESDWKKKCEECVAAVLKIGLDCAAESAKDRPEMKEALARLREIRKSFLGF